MSIKPTSIGLRKIKDPYIKYDKIVFDTNSRTVEFRDGDDAVGIIKLASPFLVGDTLTLCGIKGKIRVVIND